MKRNLTLMTICGVALVGCTTVNDTTDSVSNGVSSAYNQAAPVVKEGAIETATAVKSAAIEADDHAENLGGATKDGFYQVTDHIADWIRPTVLKPPLPIAASYCYHVYQDILCYRRPMPGWENRLAGYQPLTADPPPPAVMQPLPVRALDASRLPTNRIAGSKPVFTELPAQATDAEKPAEESSTPAAAAASEATHEQLPDPALAPQL